MNNIFPAIFNPYDLGILAILIISAALGERHGVVRTCVNLVKRLGTILISVYAAKALAPILAKAVVTPLLNRIFENMTNEYLTQSGVLAPIEENITQLALRIAEQAAFSLALVLLLIALNLLCQIIGTSLGLLTRLPILSTLNRVAGMALGLVGGALLLVIGLLLVSRVRPDVFVDPGALSPYRLDGTVLASRLIDLLPLDAALGA
jgi:uncharacterized membrane protein required for colicin V production